MPGVLTAADFVAADEPASDDAATDPDDVEDPEDVEEEVVYIYVDDDGVEHELTADEIAEFDVIVEEEDKP